LIDEYSFLSKGFFKILVLFRIFLSQSITDFWRFISEHQDFFQKNPGTSMMVHTFNKMSEEKKETHLGNAESFLKKLDEG